MKNITKDAEKALLQTVETQNKSVVKSVLYCGFSHAEIPLIDADTLALSLKNILGDHSSILYYCSDKDVFIEWVGATSEILMEVQNILAKYCLEHNPEWKKEEFFHYFDFSVHAEELRVIIKHKIQNMPQEQPVAAMPVAANTPALVVKFTPEQSNLFNEAIKTRASRNVPQIMIVEDQAFSRTLLKGLLSKQYTCHMAKNGSEAIAMYARFAPDIILLDVELPDINGHTLAPFLREIDKNAYIIMVTANNYEKDVSRAIANKVQGFIAKPYNKQKILTAIENYNKRKN